MRATVGAMTEVTIYDLEADHNRWRTMDPADEASNKSTRFRCESLSGTWQGAKFEWLDEDEEDPLPEGDMTSSAGTLIFGERAVAACGALLRRFGELLPIECDGQPFWAYNVLEVADVLDETRSELGRFSSDGQIFAVKVLVPKSAEGLQEERAFKLKDVPFGAVYCTRSFAERLLRSGVRGLRLPQMWPQWPDLSKAALDAVVERKVDKSGATRMARRAEDALARLGVPEGAAPDVAVARMDERIATASPEDMEDFSVLFGRAIERATKWKWVQLERGTETAWLWRRRSVSGPWTLGKRCCGRRRSNEHCCSPST